MQVDGLNLVEITPEGRIVSALLDGPKSYGELKSATELSHRWLSKKIKELSDAGVTECHEDRYRLTDPGEIIEKDPLFLPILRQRASPEAKVRLIAGEIGRDEGVDAVILFGSLAKGHLAEDSDIDLLIITEVEEGLNDMIYSLMFKYDVPVEAIFLNLDDLITNLQARTTFSFGLLEGYRVLIDRVGLGGLLSVKRRELYSNWDYDEESGAWIRKKHRRTSRRPTNN